MVLTYRVRARNTSAASENKIHDDATAAAYGFRGGLVPGITVYAYMTVPIVERFGFDWLERGSMQVKFHQPFYDGDEVIVRAEADTSVDPINIAITAQREDGIACATALATVNDRSSWLGEPRIDAFPEAPLPANESRPEPSRETMIPGTLLGTVTEKLALPDAQILESLDERLAIYGTPMQPERQAGSSSDIDSEQQAGSSSDTDSERQAGSSSDIDFEQQAGSSSDIDFERQAGSLSDIDGRQAVAHPFALLRLSNQILMSNFKLGPWIHVASDLINWSAARNGEQLSVRGRIADCFERKGHQFVTLDVLIVANGDRIVQQVRHTAIYRPRIIDDI